ncbi:MAG: CdaR family protein [Candidatus Aminicenantes bacterium]|jgi:YbbR domain-containing protein
MIIKLLRNVFLRNWGLKLFSFIMALILWLTLIPEDKMFAPVTVEVPLELYNIPPHMELVERVQPTIRVTIIAPNRLIPQISAANVHAVLDLSRASIDQRQYPLNKNMVSIPAGAEIREIYPMQVDIELERAKEIVMSVEVNIIGELQEGLILKLVEVSPAEVLIRGPESKVIETAKVRTTPVDISLLTQSTEIEADLILPNPDLELVDAEAKALVKLLIQQEVTEEETAEQEKKTDKNIESKDQNPY